MRGIPTSAGWPDHYGPAHIVRRTRAGDWQPLDDPSRGDA